MPDVLDIVLVLIVFVFYLWGVRTATLKFRLPYKLCKFIEKTDRTQHPILWGWVTIIVFMTLVLVLPILIFILTVTCGD